MKKHVIKKILNIIPIIITILLFIFIIYALKLGILEDKKLLIEYMKKFGIFVQIGQVVFPVIQEKQLVLFVEE